MSMIGDGKEPLIDALRTFVVGVSVRVFGGASLLSEELVHLGRCHRFATALKRRSLAA